MFNNNTSYQEAINAPARRIVGNVTVKGQKLSDDISSIDYVSSISGNTLTIGATNASTVDIKFKKLIEGLEEKELIKVSFSVQTSSGIIERQIGEFFLTEIKLDRNNKTTTLKAIDKMAFLNDKYSSTLLYPTLGKNIVQEIANSCNLRVNNNLNITNLPNFGKKLEKVTYREMLGYLAQTVGAFVIFNNNGELEFRKLNRTQKQISKGSYLLKGLEVDEVEYRINGISISLNNQEKTILAVGSPLGTQVKLTNPLMTQGWLNSIFSEYSKLRFNPFKLNWRGDPFVEVGDWVSIEIANGSYRAFPILELKLSYSGGLKSTIGANVKGTTTSTTEYKGTVERQIEFINARLGASGNYVYADTVEPTNPKEGDTWFKPNGAFTDLYIYENNQWVLKTSTGDIDGLITKITDSSVSTQHLATAIAKIIELDAARITTGSLSFQQLNSNTVSEIRKGMVSETNFNNFVSDVNGLRQEMSSEVERVFKSKESTLKGQDGKSSYIHKKYTNDVVTGPMTDNSNSLYIGIYTGDKALAPTNMSEYEWTRIRGYNGVSSYIHRKYSDYSNGANMSDNSNLKYIGIYTGTSSTPPTTASSYSWSKIKGEDGANGVPGARGTDGRTPYFHTAYSNSPTGDRDFSVTNSTNKLYIGTYSDFEVADSNDYRRYKWVKIKGEDGNNGRDGVNSYIHRKYSDNANGSSMSDNSNLKYIGIYTGTSATAPTTPTSYTWSKIKGEDGRQGVPGAKGSDGRTSYLHTAYANSATGDRDFSTTNSTNKEYIGTYTDFEINDSNDYRRYKWIKIKGENGHTLTANLRMEGTYINNVTNNIKTYLDVYYDGQKISSGFTAQVKFKGGLQNYWSSFWGANVDSAGLITNLDWGNREQNGTPLEVIVLVVYNGLNTVTNARMDNIPDVVEIKEVVKQYKTFDSRIDRFNSTIGEVKQQVLANEEKRNLILGSRMLSENDYKVFGNKDIVTRLQSYEGLPYVTLFLYGKTSNVWKGIGFNTSVNQFKQGDKYSIRIPMLISSTARLDHGGYVEIKNHRTGEKLWSTRLDTNDVQRDRWVVREFTFTASKTMSTGEYSFWIYIARNGLLTFGKPYMCAGDSLPKNYSPAPEDAHLQNSRLESSINQNKNEIDLKVSKNGVINAINISGEATKITGTAIADYLYGKTIEGATIQGNSKIKLGNHGFLQPISNGLQINAPESLDSVKGVGFQIHGYKQWFSNGNSIPKGVFIYSDDNFNTGGVMSSKNETLLTVAGTIVGRSYTDSNGKYREGAMVVTPTSSSPGQYSIMNIYSGDGYFVYNTAGDIVYVKIAQTSDVRLKKNIRETKVNALDSINKMNFKEFNWRKNDKFEEVGLIAQELQEINENFVSEKEDGLLILNEDSLRIYGLKAIQELSTENQQLKSQLKEMNERLQKLEDKINGNL